MSGRGKPAEERFEAYWESRGKAVFCHRVKDAADLRGINDGKAVRGHQQGSDYIVTDGSTFYAEVKSTEEKYRFKLSLIREEQWRVAKRVTAARGLYFFFIYTVDRRVFRVPAAAILSNNSPSIAWTELAQYRAKEMEDVH